MDSSSYVKVKVKCLSCSLHFVVCSWYKSKHTAQTLYCPECGQHEGQFMVWEATVPGPIALEVPGNAADVG